ncbi:HNH endonuclease [Cryobacterium sp. 1639]|uniref:HNH endonuclease signature motif containing protein n=1 Tax=Cryobacterium inferilacus TaxID=2866629 RepID=UPI001C73C840|nr:HNH endonuclease signature motif containing protein [Cryobacterium sp. 1639]MBX0298849.1 HNH endonuclease [Cryobacterium sp. 1639]
MSSPDQAPPPVPDDDDYSPEPAPPGSTPAPDHPPGPDRADPDWVRTELVRRTELIAAEHRAIAQAQARQAERLAELQLWSEEPQVASRLQGSPESVRLADRDAATLTEDQARAIAFGRWEDREVARRTIVSETACLLNLHERTVERLLDESLWLYSTTATFEALSAGEISYPHAKALIDQLRTLPEEDQAAFEEAVLPHAKTLPVGRFSNRAHRLREKQHPESIVIRTKNALAERHTRWEPAADGMGWLHWYGTAHDTKSAFDRIDTTAKALQQHGDTGAGTGAGAGSGSAPGSAAERAEAEQQRRRGLAQLRADITRALLLDGVTPDGLGAGIRGTVMITVPVLTLLGQSDEPATLEGYGPISPETARDIAAGAPSFTRLLTHPETGVVLSLGKTQYKNTKAMKKWLRMRDETCRFPGCNRPAVKSDVDHTDDWANGGSTDCDNLAHLCEAHHRLKHLSQWQVVQEPGGVLHWTSPGKRSYRTDPANPVAPPRPRPPVVTPKKRRRPAAASYLMPEHQPTRRPSPPVPENPPF